VAGEVYYWGLDGRLGTYKMQYSGSRLTRRACITASRFVVAHLLFLSCIAQETGPGGAKSLCDLFKHPQTYNGQVLTVRGWYRDGALRAECPGVKIFHTSQRTDDLAAVLVDEETAGDSSRTEDLFQVLLYVADLAERRAPRNRFRVSTTVTGKWMVKRDFALVVDKETGGSVGTGFGHLGVFAAQLIVSRVESVSIESMTAGK
jgi:hypothetical protein